MANWMFEIGDSARGLLSLTDISTNTLGLDADLNTFSLPANVTISDFIKALLDDATANDARVTLGVTAGNIPIEFIEPITCSLSALELEGNIVNNYGQTDNAIYWLPVAASGNKVDIVCGSSVPLKYLYIVPITSTEKVYLDGVEGTAGEGVACVPVCGNRIEIVAFKTSAGAWDWLVVTEVGTWLPTVGFVNSYRYTTDGNKRVTSTGDVRITA
jgi:hypothetical protein